MKLKYKLAYLDMAERFGETSESTRAKVGCLLVKDSGIVSEGVNGQPPKWHTEVCEGEDGRTLPTVRHAEVAALEKMQNKTETVKGSTVFLSHTPCKNCAIKLVGAGVKEVYYKHYYESQSAGSGIDYLKGKNIPIKSREELINGDKEGKKRKYKWLDSSFLCNVRSYCLRSLFCDRDKLW